MLIWRSGQVTGWTGIIRVDGTAYTWMGDPVNAGGAVSQTDFVYTSTRSVFTMNVGGKVEMNVTFLSPIYPDDEKRQSLVFTYLDVSVQSADGNAHTVELYSDISAGISSSRHVAFIYNQLTRDQNGLPETIQPMPNGTMVPVVTLHPTRSSDRSSCNSARPTTRPTGATGTGALQMPLASPTRMAQTSTSELPLSLTESWQTRKIPTTGLSTKTGQYLVSPPILALSPALSTRSTPLD